MEKVSRKRIIGLALVIGLALGLATVGFAVLRGGIGQGSLCLAAEAEEQESFGGIGVAITREDGYITVISTLQGEPADEAGVKAGDRIIKVDDEEIGPDLRIEDLVPKLRGEPGTKVKITLMRGDEQKTFTIVRKEIKVSTAGVRVLEQRCPACGWIGDPSARFCPRCGRRLDRGLTWRRGFLRPFEEERPSDWREHQRQLDQYQEALRKLEEAQRELWESFARRRPSRDWRLPFEPFPERWMPELPGVKEELRMDMDVSETDDAITVKCDMPGMKKDDIDVTLKGNVLTIKGKREVEEEQKDEKGSIVRKERRSGSFTRSFTLPAAAKSDEIKTSYKDGVLTIVIPKEKPGPKKEEEEIIKIGVDTI
jgi:HSP20 family protein